jgi:hypothetical protein
LAITRDQLSTLAKGTGAGTTFTITFPTLPVAGSSVIAALGVNLSGGVTSVKDNGTSQSTFTLDKSETGSASHVSYIYRADGISLPGSGSYTLTVTLGGSGAGYSAGAASYLGKLAGGPAATNGATATSAAPATGSATPTAGGSLLIGTFQDNSSGTADNPSVTNANFTSQLTQPSGTAGQVYGFADQIKAGTSADSCTWSVATSATYSGAIAVYSPAVTGPEADVPLLVPQAVKRSSLY